MACVSRVYALQNTGFIQSDQVYLLSFLGTTQDEMIVAIISDGTTHVKR